MALDGWIVLWCALSASMFPHPSLLTFDDSLLTSSYNGFDGSLINSLQSMDTWEDYFNHPQGGLLGLLNAIQVRTA